MMQQAAVNRSHCTPKGHTMQQVPTRRPPQVTCCSTCERQGHLHQQQQQQQQPQPVTAAEDGPQTSPGGRGQPTRRQLLLGVSSVLLAAAQMQPAQAAAAAGASCQLQQSATGMQWCDLQVGEGQLPIQSAFTKANYTAKLASTGAVFDSTYVRKQPLVFKVGECEVVKAFDVAILGSEDIPTMREGGKRLVVVPPGPMQRQGVKSLTWVAGLLDAIEEAGEPRNPEGGFNSTLVFEIELMPKRRG